MPKVAEMENETEKNEASIEFEDTSGGTVNINNEIL